MNCGFLSIYRYPFTYLDFDCGPVVVDQNHLFPIFDKGDRRQVLSIYWHLNLIYIVRCFQNLNLMIGDQEGLNSR